MDILSFEEFLEDQLESIDEAIFDDETKMGWRIWMRRNYFPDKPRKRKRKDRRGLLRPYKPSEKVKPVPLTTVKRPEDSELQDILKSR